MSKAIAGAAMIAADLAIGVTLFLDPALLAVLAPLGAAGVQALNGVIMGLFVGGVSMEAGALAQALTSNRGQNITTRQAAALRQIVYGQQRIGGIAVYESATGTGGSGGNYLYNQVIPVASHEIDAFINLYLDGRQVYWSQTPNPNGYHANIGCGTVSNPPTTSVTISGGVITGIAATGGSGFANIKPQDGYRVRIYDSGGGSGAVAWATNSGTVLSPVWTIAVDDGGSGYTSATIADVQGAYTFGGTAAADQQDSSLPGYGLGYGIGPGGPHYDFAGKVYAEVRFGDQPAGDHMASLVRNDSNWPTTARGADVAYIYLNTGYSTTLFPSPPEIRLTINGKNNIFDPRTSTYGFSSNWALQVADVITDPVWGLGDNTVNQAQLIAAANVCDELVETSQGDETRYAQHIHYDTSTAPGDALQMMMPAAKGRLSRVGGEWYIYPRYWQGASFNFDDSTLVGDLSWTPYRSFRDLINCVNGNYIAPSCPYNVAQLPGQTYDANGWYYGTTSNNWPFAWQPTNFPQYAQDVLHGYAANEWLTQDGGIVLPKELTLRGVISIVQAQRLAKLELLVNRQQGMGTFPMSVLAWQMQPLDVMQFSFSAMGWADKYLEVDKIQLSVEPQQDENGNDGAYAIACSVSVVETDPSVYEWSMTEELTPYDVPANPGQIPSTPAAPTSLTVISNAGTALEQPDGSVLPRALLEWTAPQDISVTEIQTQYQLSGATSWLDSGTVDVNLFEAVSPALIAGSTYNFRVRSVRPSGTTSAWLEVDGLVASITLSAIVTTGFGVAPPGTLVAWALSTGTANIIVNPFTATYGSLSASCLPAGPYTITGLSQSQFYWVYYVDPTFAGGAITPIATTNQADYLNKVGYFLIGSIVTPVYAPRYAPSTYITGGTASVTNPTYAYDNNLSTCAYLPSVWYTVTTPGPTYTYDSVGSSCTWSGFPSVTTSSATTLNIIASATTSGTVPAMSAVISASVSGSPTTLATLTTGAAETPYTLSIPSGTNLSTVSVTISSSITAGTSPGTGSAVVQAYEIYIQ